MGPLVLALAASLVALPPHPLNRVIGGRDGNSKPRRPDVVVSRLVDSREFARLVEAAANLAQDARLDDDAELGASSFAQRTRIILAELLSDADAVDAWRERLSSPDDGGFSPDPPGDHPLDGDIGERPRSGGSVAQALRNSRVFRRLVNQAATEAEPLREQAGLTYAEQVRTRLTELLRSSEAPSPDAPLAEPDDPVAETDGPPRKNVKRSE